MIKLRLARCGAKKRPVYRVVATDSRSPRDGRFIEQLGTYDPCRGPLFQVDDERIKHWLDHGAQPTQTVKRLLHHHNRKAPAS